MRGRLLNISDALSQLLQVTLFPRPQDTNANESISGRSHREGFKTLERVVNFIFVWDPDHCRKAVERDLQRAKDYIKQVENAKDQ
jgi:hypothetical protein